MARMLHSLFINAYPRNVFLSLRALRKPFRAAFVNQPLRFNLRFTQNFLDIIQLIQCFERRQAVHIEA